MEIITEFVQNQLLYPTLVGAVILAGVLLFTYAIRPVQQPQFLSGLDHNDRNKLGAKKKKIKEKKSTTNGHVASGTGGGMVKTEKSPVKELKKSPTSELKNKEKKVDLLPKELKKPTAAAEVPSAKKAEVQKKLNKKLAIITKPVDFDEGDWETVPSKFEKKKKIETPRAAKKQEKKPKLNVEKDEEKPQHHQLDEEEIIVSEEVVPKVVVEEEIADAVVETVVVEEKVKKPKKIKAKAPLKPSATTQIIEEVKIEEEPKIQLIIEEKIVAPTTNQNQETLPAVAPVFDELGDTWTEAKPIKKGKKKARKDN